MSDAASTVDQYTDLATDLAREFGELSGEIVVEENVGVETAAKEAFELLDLVGLEAAGVSVNLDEELLETRWMRVLGGQGVCEV